jgi:hypothetical protein
LGVDTIDHSGRRHGLLLAVSVTKTALERIVMLTGRTNPRGIFDVNMPLLYGEEGKAFKRLQEEIVRSTPDFSIFAWFLAPSDQRQVPTRELYCGILAEAPSYFSGWRKKKVTMIGNLLKIDISVSNSGVRLKSIMRAFPVPREKGSRYVLPLQCTYLHENRLYVPLRKVGDSQFLRIDPWKLHDLPVLAQLPLVPGSHSLLLRPSTGIIYWPTKTELPNSPDHIACVDRVRLGYSGLRIELAHNVQLVQALPRSRFDDEDQEFFAPSGIKYLTLIGSVQ